MAICRTCLQKVMMRSNYPTFFDCAEENYYCDNCDSFLDIEEVAHAVIINGNGEKTFFDLQSDPKRGD